MNRFSNIGLLILTLISLIHTKPVVELREGDILIQNGKARRSFGLVDRTFNWPNGVVPYEIDPYARYTYEQIEIIKSGMALLTAKTDGCITFVPKNHAHKNWVVFRNYGGCYSLLGMSPTQGGQDISLQSGDCTYKGTVVHEIMHALGFWHEQNRPDRDQYIYVNYANISPGLHSAFDINEGSTYNTPYDLKSIMQYYEYAFSSNGGKTIIPRNGEKLIPLFEKNDAQIMTKTDIQAVKNLYQCSSGPVTDTPNPDRLNIQLKNDLNVLCKIYWINYKGEEVHYGDILPGSVWTQETAIGHEWILMSTDFRIMFKAALAMDSKEIDISSLFTTELELDHPFTIVLYNDENQTVQVNWLNNSEEILYHELAPGSQITQKTYVGHTWTVKGDGLSKTFIAGRGKVKIPDYLVNISDL